MRKYIYFAVIIIAVVAVWWFVGAPQPPATPGPGAPSAAETSTGAAAPGGQQGTFTRSAYFDERTTSSLGAYLTDASGTTLYIYTKDAPNVSNCKDGCLAAWPPYGPGIAASGTYNLPMLPADAGTIVGNDGMVQFTWKGMPLYYYAKDTAPGDVAGQGVGGVWYVVQL